MSRFDHTELKKVRTYLKWSVPELVERLRSVGLEISEGTIDNWESGATTPDADKLAVIAAVFGVGIERFYPEK